MSSTTTTVDGEMLETYGGMWPCRGVKPPPREPVRHITGRPARGRTRDDCARVRPRARARLCVLRRVEVATSCAARREVMRAARLSGIDSILPDLRLQRKAAAWK